jgi:hypothetical protein
MGRHAEPRAPSSRTSIAPEAACACLARWVDPLTPRITPSPWPWAPVRADATHRGHHPAGGTRSGGATPSPVAPLRDLQRRGSRALAPLTARYRARAAGSRSSPGPSRSSSWAAASSARAGDRHRGLAAGRQVGASAGDRQGRPGPFESRARRGVGDRVRWLGPRPDTERWYAAADTVVLPTRYEPFGNVHLESLASGVDGGQRPGRWGRADSRRRERVRGRSPRPGRRRPGAGPHQDGTAGATRRRAGRRSPSRTHAGGPSCSRTYRSVTSARAQDSEQSTASAYTDAVDGVRLRSAVEGFGDAPSPSSET